MKNRSRTNVIKNKVKRPWPEYAPELLIWSPFCGDGLVYVPEIIPDARLDALRDVMAAEGVQATRDFGWCTVDPGDPSNGKRLLPWLAGWAVNPAYWAQVKDRVMQWVRRDGTYIISVVDACSFYKELSFETNPFKALLGDRPQDIYLPGAARDILFEYARQLARRIAIPFAPRVIIQTRNEGPQSTAPENLYDFDHALIRILKTEGVPVRNIMIGYYDSSYCARTLLPPTWTDPDTGDVYHGEDLMGQGLADAHNRGTPECLENAGAKARRDISWGAFPSCDGPTDGSEGLGWSWLPPGVNLRPSPAQAKRIVQIMKGYGRPAFEWWSSAVFQKSVFPNIDDAINIGREERLALAAGLL